MTVSPVKGKRGRIIGSDSPVENEYSAIKAQRIEEKGSRSPDKKRRRAEAAQRLENISNDSWGGGNNNNIGFLKVCKIASFDEQNDELRQPEIMSAVIID